MKTKSIILIISLMFAFSCGQVEESKSDEKTEISGTISVSGAFALYPLTVKWAEEFQKINPGVRIDISAGGAGKGMTDVLSGMVDLAMFSRSVSPEEEAKGAWYIAVAKDAVLPTVNVNSPAYDYLLQHGLTKEEFSLLFLDETPDNWEQISGKQVSGKINVYTRSDACGAAEMWARFMDKKQEDLFGIGVFGDPGMADAVKNDLNGVGFNNVIYAYDIKTRKNYDGLAIIPIDINANDTIEPGEYFYNTLDEVNAAIKEGRYPSPPARDLYLVSKGKPENPVVNAFLNWILTDGQKFIDEAGYVQLTSDHISKEQGKLK